MAQYVANTIEIIQRYLNEYLEQQQQQQHHDFLDVDDGENIVRCFLDKASSFCDFLIHSNFIIGVVFLGGERDEEAYEQLIRVRDGANKAEDAVERRIITNYYINQQQPAHFDDDSAGDDGVIHELDEVAEEFESIKYKILKRGKHQPTLKWPIDLPSQAAMKKKKQLSRKVNDFVEMVSAEFLSIKQKLLNRAGTTTQQTLFNCPIHHSPADLLVPSTSKSSSSFMKKKRKVDDFAPIYEDELHTLKSRILQPNRQLQIIPILGAAVGMGKRTLTLRLHNDSSVVDHFHVRACISATFDIDVKVILLNLLESLGHVITKEIRRQTVDEVGLILTDALKYYKYFILIHYITNVDMWCKLRRFFPDDNCGSRILYTGGDLDFRGKESQLGGEAHMMRFLRNSESWLLFCHMVFQQDHCPLPELQAIAKQLVGYCKGIAQLICLVAGLLATSEMNPSFWKIVAQTLKSELRGREDYQEKQVLVAALIYNHLPYYLKPCLLYILAFRECYDIRASNIFQLWIAKGVVKKSADNSLEDIAHAYLEILIDKNLLHLSQQDPTGRVKAFHIQPVLRGIYTMLAYFEKFVWSKDFHVKTSSGHGEDYNIDNIRCVSGSQLLQPSDQIEISPLVRSFISTGHASPQQTHVFVGLELLRILAVYQLELFQFPAEILQMFLLRYLSFSCHSNTPTSISKLWNLQTLIIRRLPWFRAFSLPVELLEMAQLTHVKCKETFIWRHSTNGKKFLNAKLETLSSMQLFGLSNEFFEQIPNIKKLGIFCNTAMHYVLDLAYLDKLERLKCSTDWSLASKNFLSNIKFPSMLRKLTLTLCRIPSGFMKVVGVLSSLEELKLQKSDFLVTEPGPTEPEWEPEDGEFRRLISLVMKDLNLVHWKAGANHFPRLRQLIILNCYAMLGLPEEIGDIQTLELIHVNKHSPSVVASAMKIKEKHCENPNLEVKITKSWGR